MSIFCPRNYKNSKSSLHFKMTQKPTYTLQIHTYALTKKHKESFSLAFSSQKRQKIVLKNICRMETQNYTHFMHCGWLPYDP